MRDGINKNLKHDDKTTRAHTHTMDSDAPTYGQKLRASPRCDLMQMHELLSEVPKV